MSTLTIVVDVRELPISSEELFVVHSQRAYQRRAGSGLLADELDWLTGGETL
jgi:hypothetical protein